MEFEWDTSKAHSNLEKHGISFAEAMTVFGDPLEAPRFLSLGRSEQGRLLVVPYTEREGGSGLSAPENRSPGSGKRMSGNDPISKSLSQDPQNRTNLGARPGRPPRKCGGRRFPCLDRRHPRPLQGRLVPLQTSSGTTHDFGSVY